MEEAPQLTAQIPLDLKVIQTQLSSLEQDYVLKGLLRGSVGFLIAPPDTGKSHLCLSIAYELGTGLEILGFTDTTRRYRTLIWSIEDPLAALLPRVETHLRAFNKVNRDLIASNVSIYTPSAPLCSMHSSDKKIVEAAKTNLIETAKQFDLLIIDTLREAVGSADEVKDDALIRQTLDQIAKEADIAILVVHHPTKNVARGLDSVNSVAGSGLSSTLSKSKLHLYLNKVTSGKDKGQITVQHIKANYLSSEDKISTPQKLSWTEASILCRFPEEFASQIETPSKATKKTKPLNIPKEPIMIDVDNEPDYEKPIGGLSGKLSEMLQKKER